MLEYAIMLGLIAVFCIVVVTAIGLSVNRTFRTVSGCSGGHGVGDAHDTGGTDFGCGPAPTHHRYEAAQPQNSN